jgi:predicted membrane-bound spermidine synthase
MGEYLDKIIPKVSIPEGQSGQWSVKHVDIPDNVVQRFRERYFEPGRYTQLFRGGHLVMSDTPAERRDHLGFVQASSGDVLISGLGLGMCLGAVLRKPEVQSVTVLEISADVIALVAPSYKDERVNIVQADARQWTPPKGKRFRAVWHDIWDDICSDNLPEMRSLNRRYGKRADWKGCWSQDLIRT